MRRLILAFIGALLVGALFISPADAVTYQGGTPEQVATVQVMLEQCRLDYRLVEQKLGYVEIVFKPGGYQTPQLSAQGAAWGGCIILDSALTGVVLAYIAAHEWSHEIWFAMPWAWRVKWMGKCGYGGATWLTMPSENFAECMRVALWSGQENARTSLPVISPDRCWRFLVDWRATDCRHGRS